MDLSDGLADARAADRRGQRHRRADRRRAAADSPGARAWFARAGARSDRGGASPAATTTSCSSPCRGARAGGCATVVRQARGVPITRIGELTAEPDDRPRPRRRLEPLPAGLRPLLRPHDDVARASAAGSTSCCTRTTRRSERPRPTRSASSSASRRCSGSTPSSAWSFAFAFNLNRVAVLLGIYSNLPWILPAYYTLATLLGAAILRVEVPPGPAEAISTRRSRTRRGGSSGSSAHALTPLLWAYVLGSTIGARRSWRWSPTASPSR